MIACAAPNPSVDRLFATSALLPGAIHRPDAATAEAGGKGLNAARAAHVLGADVRAVALVGGHAGRWIADRLAADGVAADLVWGAGETRTCLSVATGGALTEFYEPGDPPGDDVWAAFAARVAAVAGRASWVALCGSLPPGVDAAEAARLVAAARAAGAHVAVDHAGAALEAAVGAAPDLVKVNAAEAEELTGEADPLAAAIALRAAGRRGASRRRGDARRARRAAARGRRGAARIARRAFALPGRVRRRVPRRAAHRGAAPRRLVARRVRARRSARAPRTPSSRAPAASIPLARGRWRAGRMRETPRLGSAR